MSANIYPVLRDLLFCYQAGSKTSYRELFYKALNYFNAEYDKREIGKKIDTTFRRFNDFGLIETSKRESSINWRSMKGSFIEYDANQFLLYTTKIDEIQFKKSYFQYCIGQVTSYKINITPEVTFEISFPVYSFDDSLKTKITFNSDIGFIYKNYNYILDYCPEINVAWDYVFSSVEPFILLEDYQVERYHFESKTWIVWNKKNQLEPGFFRISNNFGFSGYVVLYLVNNSLKAHQSRYYDWGYMLATYKLDKPIYCTYLQSEGALEIPTNAFSYFPALLRRSLIVQSFKWPEIINKHYRFENLSNDQIDKFRTMFPSIRVQVQ